MRLLNRLSEQERDMSIFSDTCCTFSIFFSLLSLGEPANGKCIALLISVLFVSPAVYIALAIRLARKLRLVAALDEELIEEYKHRLGYSLAHHFVTTEILKKKMEEFYRAWSEIDKGVEIRWQSVRRL